MPVDPWMDGVLDAERMRAVDAWAIEERGVPSLELMETAGAALAEVVRERAGEGPIRVVCGKGNNGGDGLVAARLLRETGHEVEVILLGRPGELSDDAEANLARLDHQGVIEHQDCQLRTALAGSGTVVDAIFGTGFSGAPRAPADAAIDAINASGAPVVAADIASGVDAATGEAEGVAVEADATVTFHSAKLGHWIAPGRDLRGELVVAPIGIPGGAPAEPGAGLITDRVLALAPTRGAGSTKFSSGQVLVVGASPGLTGAVCMASAAAIRAGAGYATAAVPVDLQTIVEIKLTEVMSRGIGSGDTLGEDDADAIAAAAEGAAAVALGPGLGRDESSLALARALPPRIEAPLVIDADGLNAHAGRLDSLRERGHPTVLTPHEGELGRLLEVESSAVKARRLEHAREAARRSGAIVVLKGDDTIVVSGEGDAERLAIKSTSTPSLATAGTGDVLTGTVGGAPRARDGALRRDLRRGPRPRTRRDRGRARPRRRVGDRHRRDRGAAGRARAGERRGGLVTVAAEAPVRAVARVDLGAIERNCRGLRRSLAAGSQLCAVVKSDAYGHGAVPAARAALAGGATTLGVATAAEAAELREHLPDARILTMGALSAPELEQALRSGSEIAAWRRDTAAAAGELGAALGFRPRVHVKYDTGMGRLGEADPAAILDVVRTVTADPRLELAGFWTHFATADELEGPGSQHYDAQLARFRELADRVRAQAPGVLLHAANSAATLRDKAAHFGMVRCGIAIYGLDPFGADPSRQGLEPALELGSYVAEVKTFPAGASAGYGRRWSAAQETRVGVLPIGYGDGVRRALTNNADVLVGGRRVPLVGTVSMDNITVDLGPNTGVERGAPAVLIGSQGADRILCEEVARRLGTINYEVTCGISKRVPRVYA